MNTTTRKSCLMTFTRGAKKTAYSKICCNTLAVEKISCSPIATSKRIRGAEQKGATVVPFYH